jgi:hypothetical protein
MQIMCSQKINDAMSKTLLAGEKFEDFETHFHIKSKTRVPRTIKNTKSFKV